MSLLFSNYLVVDWSAASVPKTGADSIWYAWLERGSACQCANPATRWAAFDRIRARLVRAVRESRATLAVFDFPLGYPRGAGHWRQMWRTITSLVQDDDANRNNRFDAARVLNEKLGGPFWGRPGKGVRKPPADRHGLPEMRIADSWVRGPQSPWKLYGVGSAGSQALTGIPYLERLRQDPELGSHVRVWPFETGLTAPGHDALIAVAEAWPSILRPRIRPGEVKDRAQVRSLARHFERLDRAGELAGLFEGPTRLTARQRRHVEREEGWILALK